MGARFSFQDLVFVDIHYRLLRELETQAIIKSYKTILGKTPLTICIPEQAVKSLKRNKNILFL